MNDFWTKVAAATEDFGFDFQDWLPAGDEISAATWIVPAGLTLIRQSFTDTTATVWVSGGTAAQRYELTCHFSTVGGRTDERTQPLQVVAKRYPALESRGCP